MRPTSYALHIRPLFRQVDIDHMADLGADLATLEGVTPNAAAILARLQDPTRPMPPVADNGPWPEEWIALFDRWIKEGCPA
jgi:hypothetical protein